MPKLFPSFPRSELEFGRYLHYWLQKHGYETPAFMKPIEDTERIQKIIIQWHREEEIEEWRRRLSHEMDDPSAAMPGLVAQPVGLRLQLDLRTATLMWRKNDEDDFEPLKSAMLKQWVSAHAAGTLSLPAGGQDIWQPFYCLADVLRMTKFELTDPQVRNIVNGLLRREDLQELIVSANRLPFKRHTESLQWKLREASSENDDYELYLAKPDGGVFSEHYLTFPGRPTLYMARAEIWAGPTPVRKLKEYGSALRVPAPALETQDGVELLSRLGVGLPARLNERVRRVKMRVRITGHLKPVYPGSTEEMVCLDFEAVSEDGHRAEFFSPAGWSKDADPRRLLPKEDQNIKVLDRAALEAVPVLVQTLGATWDSYQQGWKLRLTRNFADKFVSWLATVPGDVELKLDPQLATLRDAPVSASVRLDCESAGVDWFDLRVVLDVKDTTLSKEELKLLLDARGRYVRLGKKGWRRLQFNVSEEEDGELARLGLSPHDLSSEPQRLHALQLADKAAARFLPEERVAEIHRRASEIKTRVTPDVPKTVCAQLRRYQTEGFHFLSYLATNRFGGVLADDMGLGKTLQTLTWLEWLRAEEKKTVKTSLVVCPKSVMDNWRSEAERFSPTLRVKVWRGSDGVEFKSALGTTDLIVINYAQLRSLESVVKNVNWMAVILDEGQYIKNPQSQTATVARGLRADYRLVLTGTPIENRLMDLWSLMAFAMPGVLGNKSQFMQNFDRADDPLARQRLAARVRPFLLRRTKQQVATDLPARIEEDLLCSMEGAQETLYRAELKHAQQMLLKVKTRQEFDKQRFNFLTSLLRLRQICCHPGLVSEKHTHAESAKLEALTDLLEPLMQEGHKVLVFSQFVGLLDLLRPVMDKNEWPVFYLTGATENRGDLIQNFQNTKGAAVFLISLKAGGFGLNLTAASYVVLFDPWWNPAVENQAIDRTHRIGQSRQVIAYRLLIKNSIEEKIRTLQKTKSALANDVLGEENFTNALSIEDLRFLFADEAT
jgi:hypothetical protein